MSRDLPDGWVWISDYDTRQPGDFGKTGPTGIYAAIQKGIRKHPTKIRHYRDGKCIAANKSDIDAFLSGRNKQPKPLKKPAQTTAAKVCSEDAAFSLTVDASHIRELLAKCVDRLGNLCDLLDAVAASTKETSEAVQNIATKPAAPQGDLQPMASDNGFHN